MDFFFRIVTILCIFIEFYPPTLNHNELLCLGHSTPIPLGLVAVDLGTPSYTITRRTGEHASMARRACITRLINKTARFQDEYLIKAQRELLQFSSRLELGKA